MSKGENSINSYKTYYNQTDQIHQMFQRLEKVHKDNCFYSEYPGYTVMRFIRDSSIFYRIFVISQDQISTERCCSMLVTRRPCRSQTGTV